MFFLFLMMAEVQPKLFVSSVGKIPNLASFCAYASICICHDEVELDTYVIGGPAVGDIRSRCLRLSDESTAEALAVKRLLGHRLPIDAVQAKSEW